MLIMNMYEEGARIKDIAAYIGDLESTVSKYYIAARKKTTINGMEHHYVPVPQKGIRSEEERAAMNASAVKRKPNHCLMARFLFYVIKKFS